MVNKPEFLDVFPPIKEFKMQFIYNKHPVQVWLNWVNNELTPPIRVSNELAYVLKAFKESLEYIKQHTEVARVANGENTPW